MGEAVIFTVAELVGFTVEEGVAEVDATGTSVALGELIFTVGKGLRVLVGNGVFVGSGIGEIIAFFISASSFFAASA